MRARPVVVASDHTLSDELRSLERRAAGRRYLLGICGPPGAGKSTVADRIARDVRAEAVVVPMDGFHLASAVIAGTPLAERRGAPDTFDGGGFVALLERLRRQTEPVVYAPRYDRSIEDPIAGAIAIHDTTGIVIVEGNYLLHSSPPWTAAARLLDEIWYVEHADDATRVERLVARHVRFGKSRHESTRWVEESDERNARLVAERRSHADLVLTESADGELHVSRP